MYLQGVVLRAENINNIYNKQLTQIIVFDLSRLYNIERFLAALKQQAGRYVVLIILLDLTSLYSPIKDKKGVLILSIIWTLFLLLFD